MNAKVLPLAVGVMAAVLLGAAVFLRGGISEPKSGGDASGLTISKNAIYVSEQVPARTIVVAVAKLARPGFVVIHEDANGAPGKILGVSTLLPAGETSDVPLTLSRLAADGETLYAMLHLDGGDGAFDLARDQPARDAATGEPVAMIFTVSPDATEPGAVSL